MRWTHLTGLWPLVCSSNGPMMWLGLSLRWIVRECHLTGLWPLVTSSHDLTREVAFVPLRTLFGLLVHAPVPALKDYSNMPALAAVPNLPVLAAVATNKTSNTINPKSMQLAKRKSCWEMLL